MNKFGWLASMFGLGSGLDGQGYLRIETAKRPTWCHATKKGPGRSGTMIQNSKPAGTRILREQESKNCTLKHKRYTKISYLGEKSNND